VAAPSIPNLGRLVLHAVSYVLWREGFLFSTYVYYVQLTCTEVVCMSNITVRVPEELRGRMKRCKSINWSDIARKAFEDAARKEEIQCAAEAIKKLRLESEAKWDGAKEIRKWRDTST